ncbi:class I SAM-dependent methyltransferase [Paenibacillus macerans]|uniref:class I SAM-dependent methyltransferase n=1 Tax=Paenibacillus macerans TaxID=44252 RepID=UPI002DBFDF62|nr:class I SAM-dependent methyltransferase [Paenibacillus macerans]MEC0332715.1 class I SAM-dependent methyltransferase [Paenibacillus macerans]
MKEEALYDRWWHAPAEGEQRMEDSHAPFWEKVLGHMVEKEGMRDFSVLDFGCNQGGFLRFLYARHSFKEGVGTDLGIESIRVANERKGDLPLTYVATASPEQWGRRFDLAISTAVIYLISDLREHAQKIKAALKPGGVYYASYSDYSNNPSLPQMREKIDSGGKLPMNLHSLDDIAGAFLTEGFTAGITRLTPKTFIPLSENERFFQSVRDRIQYEYEEAYLFRFTAPL